MERETAGAEFTRDTHFKYSRVQVKSYCAFCYPSISEGLNGVNSDLTSIDKKSEN